MKKLLAILTLILSFSLVPLALLAQDAPVSGCTVSAEAAAKIDICSVGACTFEGDTDCAVCCLFTAVYTVKNWVFFAVMAVSTIMVILGAFSIVTAGGDPSKLSSGRNYILYAMIGFAVALFSTAIPTLVQGLLGL
jgi:hypothetical protein